MVRRLMVFTLLALVTPGASADLFIEGFESGELTDERWKVEKYEGCKIEYTAEQSRSGKQAIRFIADPGTRCEILPKYGNPLVWRLLHEPFNEERWYSFSVLLPIDSEFSPQNEVVAQWHSSRDKFFGEEAGRGPPLALRILGGNWRITYGHDSDFLSQPGSKAIWPLWEEKLEPGVWVDWIFRVRWSYEDDGYIDIWKDGVQVVNYTGPNTYNDLRGVYLKIGSYHPGVPRVLYFDEIRVGDEDESFESMLSETNP